MDRGSIAAGDQLHGRSIPPSAQRGVFRPPMTTHPGVVFSSSNGRICPLICFLICDLLEACAGAKNHFSVLREAVQKERLPVHRVRVIHIDLTVDQHIHIALGAPLQVYLRQLSLL